MIEKILVGLLCISFTKAQSACDNYTPKVPFQILRGVSYATASTGTPFRCLTMQIEPTSLSGSLGPNPFTIIYRYYNTNDTDYTTPITSQTNTYVQPQPGRATSVSANPAQLVETVVVVGYVEANGQTEGFALVYCHGDDVLLAQSRRPLQSTLENDLNEQVKNANITVTLNKVPQEGNCKYF